MKAEPRSIPSIARCCNGAVAIEFALIALPLLLLLLGAVEFGRALNIHNQMHRAADVGARDLLIDPNATAESIQIKMRQVLQIIEGSNLSVTLVPQTINGRTYKTIVATFPVKTLVPLIIKSSYTVTVRRSALVQ